MSELTQAEYQIVLRQDLYSFTHRCFLELNPSTAFMPNWHIELMAASLPPVAQARSGA